MNSFIELKKLLNKKNYIFCYTVTTMIILQSCDISKEVLKVTNLNEQASIDFSKNKENSENSPLEYNSNTGFNEVVTYDWSIFGQPVFSSPAFNLFEGDQNAYFVPEKKSNGALILRAGIGYIGKGAKYKDADIKIRLNYLEIPIYALYHYKLGESGGVYGGLGPYFAYGIGGKVKGEGSSQSSFGEDRGGYKRFDAGLGFKAGYEFSNGFFVDLSYELGLANIAYASEDVTSHSRCLSINLGYNIGRLFVKKKK
jgi:hypothetical protein